MKSIDLAAGLRVSQLGFGCMALTPVYGGMDDDAALATLNHALDIGVTFLDTADVYGAPRPGTVGPAGTNEETLARVLRHRSDEVQLATKFGITGALGDAAAEETRRTAGDRGYVRAACEASLRRLGVEHIDLYYMHRRELDRPIEETVAAMAELVDEGKVGALGLSEVTASELRAASAVHPIAAVQSEWSLWSRDVERHVVPACAELGVGFVPYSPLGRGFLTGTLTPARVASGLLKGQPRFDQHFDANQRVVDMVAGVAAEVGATPAQVALAWLYAQGRRFGLPVVPIPGTRRAERVDENAGAVDVTLSELQLQRLEEAASLVVGGRNLTYNDDDWISDNRE